MMPALLHHKPGNDTGYGSSGSKSRVADAAHQSQASGSVDKVDVLLCKNFSKFFGCFEIDRINFSAGSTVYAYILDIVHGLFSFCKDR